MHLILDTGPWVALHCKGDKHHDWAKAQFAQHTGLFLTCEAVVAETCFLLARAGFDPSKALALLERGVVCIGMTLGEQSAAVRGLFERYDNVPASLADGKRPPNPTYKSKAHSCRSHAQSRRSQPQAKLLKRPAASSAWAAIRECGC